jgi:hypothetical protein
MFQKLHTVQHFEKWWRVSYEYVLVPAAYISCVTGVVSLVVVAVGHLYAAEPAVAVAAAREGLLAAQSSQRELGLPGRFHPQFLDQNRRDIGKSLPKRTASKMETPGSPGVGGVGAAAPGIRDIVGRSQDPSKNRSMAASNSTARR